MGVGWLQTSLRLGPMSTPILSSYADAFQAAVVVCVTGLALAEYRRAKRHDREEKTLHLDARIDDLNRDRMRLEAIFNRNLDAILGLRDDLGPTGPYAVEEVLAVIHSMDKDADGTTQTFESELRTFLSRLQILALAVNAGVADYRFAFELLGSTTVRWGIAMTPWIEHIRAKTGQSLLYGDLTHLAVQWQHELIHERSEFAKTGKPYYLRNRKYPKGSSK
jgi:hypothetical protein